MRPHLACKRSTQYVLSVALALLPLLATNVQAQTKDQTTTLVQQLGSTSYAERDQAYDRLQQLGRQAIPALERGLKGKSLEIRTRCQLLLRLARRSDLEIRLSDFALHGPQKGVQPLEGWVQYQKVMGNDPGARLLFVEIYKTDSALLKLAQKDPKEAGGQLKDRYTKITRRPYFFQNGAVTKTSTTVGEVGAMLYALKCAGGQLDRNTFNQVCNALSRQDVYQVASGSAQIRKLISEALQQQGMSQQTFYQWYNLVQRYQLSGLGDDALRKEIGRQIDDAVKDTNRVSQLQSVATYATQLGYTDIIQDRLLPAIRKLAQKASEGSPNVNTLYSLSYVAQQLQMKELTDDVLKPAILKVIRNLPKNSTSISYQVHYAARTLGLQEELKSELWPSLQKQLSQAVQNPSESQIYQLLNQANYLGMSAQAQALLQPASIQLLSRYLGRGKSIGDLTTAHNLASRTGTLSTINELFQSRIAEQLQAMQKKTPSVSEIQQWYSLSQRSGLRKNVEKPLKEMVVKAIGKLSETSLKSNDASRLMYLAQSLQLKEVVPLALRVALSDNSSQYVRANALKMVGQLGGKEEIKSLTPLLKDTHQVSSMDMGTFRIQTQIRDVALATMIHLQGESIIKYGYDYAVTYRREYPNLSYSSLGFSTNKIRDAAFAKWKEKQENDSTAGS